MNPKECYEKFSPFLWLKPENEEEVVKSDVLGRLLGVSIILNMLGYRKIKNAYLRPVILTDEHLLTEVVVNDGKIYAVLPKEPLFDYTPLLRKPHIKISSSKKDAGRNSGKFFFWPLNWSPRVPRACEKPLPGLLKFNNQYIGIPNLKPWSSLGPTETNSTKLSTKNNLSMNIGPLRIYYKGRLFVHRNLFATSENFDLLVNLNENIIYLNRAVEKELKLNCYDYYIHLLHPGGWITARINDDNLIEFRRIFLLIISCPKGAFYLSSSKGFKIYMEPGKVLLETKNPIVLGSGTYISSLRALLETVISPLEVQDRVYVGSPRGEVIAILGELNEDALKIFVWNPTPTRTLFETRFKHRITSAEMCDPLGNHEIFVERDLIKIPLPPHWMGCVEVRIKSREFLQERFKD